MATERQWRPEWAAFIKEHENQFLLHCKTWPELQRSNEQFVTNLLKRYPDYFATWKLDPSIRTSEHKTASGIRMKAYVPSNLKPNLPTIVYIHGGGFCVGDIASEEPLVERYIREMGMVFVSIEYRLAPKHPFPAGLDDCVEAAEWCIENGASLGGQRGKIITFGGSAGGNLALSTALKLIEGGHGEAVQGVFAVQPVTVHPDSVGKEKAAKYTSYRENADISAATADAMHVFLDAYAAPKTDPYAYPLLHPNLKALPRVWLATAEMDTLRDDGTLLKDALDEAGVPNQFVEFKGVPHWFFTSPSKHLDPVKNEWYALASKGMKFLLHGEQHQI